MGIRALEKKRPGHNNTGSWGTNSLAPPFKPMRRYSLPSQRVIKVPHRSHPFKHTNGGLLVSRATACGESSFANLGPWHVEKTYQYESLKTQETAEGTQHALDLLVVMLLICL